MSVASGTLVPETLLDKCRQRAAGYDRDNRFCQEDFDELKAAGYLKMAVPRELGGHGFTLAEVARETRRLAGYAPATALCINMHNYWVGDAADLWRAGDKSCEWILRDAAAGKCSRPGMPRAATKRPFSCRSRRPKRCPAAIGSPVENHSAVLPAWTRC